ncbi:MAG TPA: ATP-binding protein [Candidatus Limnocylindrales bacterium]|nr:ATP-binding protein [Candidatus Limnocylindrales bacterium]
MRPSARRAAIADIGDTRTGIRVDAGVPRRIAGLRGLDAAVGLAVVLVLTGFMALLGGPVDEGVLMRALIGLAALLVAALARTRAPSVAWIAAVGASGCSATLWFDRARPLLVSDVGAVPWVAVAAVASVWAIATALLAASYATRPGVRLDPVAVPVASVIVGWLVVACLTTVGLVLGGQRAPDPAFTWVDVATVPIGVFLPLLLVLLGLGVVADVRAAIARADSALRGGSASSDGSPSVGISVWDLAVATARELLPGQASIAAEAREVERLRLAGDLHAAVLPALRRAIADAERGGAAETLAASLHAIDLELERLMADRWPVVLEAFGLVRAVEDLAERLEASGSPPISIDVDAEAEPDARADADAELTPGASAGPSRPPIAVERAAWRYVEIVLDNAVRHARANAIAVHLHVAPRRVRIVVSDDGIGPGVDQPSGRRGRGLADARRRAEAVGATVSIAHGGVAGTVARFEWSAPASV